MRALPVEKLYLAGLTGRGVKVAVVDSGINPWHSHVKGIAGGVNISLGECNQIAFDDEDIYDEIGHGTACAAAIRQKAPEADLYSVKIFDKTLATYTVVLIEAIRWCVDKGIDIINLSLGTQNNELLPYLKEACGSAHRKGIVIVAAARNGAQEGYPACLPEVLGVGSHPQCQQDVILYKGGSPVKFLASSYPRPLPGLPSEYNFRGESLASAHFSGVIALLKQKYPSSGLEDIQNLLLSLG